MVCPSLDTAFTYESQNHEHGLGNKSDRIRAAVGLSIVSKHSVSQSPFMHISYHAKISSTSTIQFARSCPRTTLVVFQRLLQRRKERLP